MKYILHVVSCLERGGTEAFIMNCYRNLDRSKYQFDFMVFIKKDYPYIKEIESLGGNVYFVQAPSIKKIGAFLRDTIKILKSKKYCAIHSHINIENAWIMVAGAIAKIPIRVSHSHDTIGKEGTLLRRTYRLLQNNLIKCFATEYLACSKDAGEYLYGKKFFKEKGKVIHNGIAVRDFIDVSEDKVTSLKNKLDIQESCNLVLGNITRFENKKNQLFIIEVFREIVKMNKDAVLLLGGPDGGILELVKKRVSELGLESNVRFIGIRQDIPVCLKCIDIYLFPSLYEGFGIALLEAQAAGCYGIASKGVSEEVDLGLGRVLFCDLNDAPEVWAKKIINCKNNLYVYGDDEIENVFLKRGYDIRQAIQELVKVYDKSQEICK